MNSGPITDEDIARLVPAFYRRVRQDQVLGPIFEQAIGDWSQHLEKLQSFWSSVMLGSGRYKGQPMVEHIRHEPHMTPENFSRWLTLWHHTTNDLLGKNAAQAFQEKADRIAESLQLGVQFHRDRKLS